LVFYSVHIKHVPLKKFMTTAFIVLFNFCHCHEIWHVIIKLKSDNFEMRYINNAHFLILIFIISIYSTIISATTEMKFTSYTIK
jgi:hypothetical protein